MTCTADTKMLDVPVAMPWRAAPDARTLVMRVPELGELARVPEHTPVPGPLPVPPVQVAAARPRPEAFAMLRRIALQRDLASAVGVLHLELGALVGAKVVLAVVADEQISCPLPDDLRAAAPLVPLAALQICARQRRSVYGEHAIVIPIELGATAVLFAYRPLDAAAFTPEDLATMVGVAGRLAILDHFFAADAERRRQAADDRATIFRPAALAAAREQRREGELVGLSARWVKLAVPVVLAIAAVLIAVAALVQVPTYSRGTVVVTMNGSNVIATSAGRIARVLVAPGQHVAAGAPLIELDTQHERQEYDQVDTLYRDQLSTFLFDPTDEAARSSLAGIVAQRQAAATALAAKTISSPVEGQVSAILANDLVNAGEHVATIIGAAAQPSVTAYMPGSDRSRLKPGMTLRFSMPSYADAHLDLEITEVGQEVIGQTTARKLLGQKLADAVQLPPSIAIVKARLPASSFESRGETFNFFDGMDGIGEIEIDHHSFLSVVLPTGDK
jgi:multidrug efflux pump subunit AcrA (membrane-fusion protein)